MSYLNYYTYGWFFCLVGASALTCQSIKLLYCNHPLRACLLIPLLWGLLVSEVCVATYFLMMILTSQKLVSLLTFLSHQYMSDFFLGHLLEADKLL